MYNEVLKDCIVYDNGGETLDRYTVFTPDGNVYGMSETGSGFDMWIGDHSDIEQGEHLGVKLSEVPEDIQRAVMNRLIESGFNGQERLEKLSKPTEVNEVSQQESKLV